MTTTNHEMVFAAMARGCIYRPMDLHAQLKMSRSAIYQALRKLRDGMVIELERDGRRTLYVTRQGGLFE